MQLEQQTDWLKILRDEVAKSNITQVALKLGYARTSISQALSETYNGGIGKIRAKVIATFCDRIVCPHTKIDLSQEDCEQLRNRPMPQSDPHEFHHWGACQYCAFNPNAKTAKELSNA